MAWQREGLNGKDGQVLQPSRMFQLRTGESRGCDSVPCKYKDADAHGEATRRRRPHEPGRSDAVVCGLRSAVCGELPYACPSSAAPSLAQSSPIRARSRPVDGLLTDRIDSGISSLDVSPGWAPPPNLSGDLRASMCPSPLTPSQTRPKEAPDSRALPLWEAERSIAQ